MRSLKTLGLTLILIFSLPAFGAIYMKFDGVDGSVTAAGHEKWIELTSLQNEDGTPVTGMLDAGRVRVSSSSGSYVTHLDRLCKSKASLGNVLVDIDGKRHVLRNARFAECPMTRGDVSSAVLEFGSPRASLRSGAQPTTVQRGNATLSRLGRTPFEMDIRRATLNGNVATIALKAGTVPESLAKAIMEATAKGTVFPVIGIESAGQQWSFTKVMFTSASYAQPQDLLFSFQFETMNGSAAAFQALGN